MTAALLFGVLAGASLPGHLWPAGLLSAAGFLIVFRSMRRGRAVAVAPVLLFFSLGYLSIQPWVASRLPDDHVTRFADGRVYTLRGIVDEPPVVSGERVRMVITAKRLGRGEDLRPATGRIRISATAIEAVPRQGDEITLDTKIRPIRNFNNPGGFDYQRFMAFRKIRVSGYARKGTLHIAARRHPSDGAQGLAGLRARVCDLVAALPMKGDERNQAVKGVLKALLIGDRGGLTPAVRDLFSRTGTSHLLAISGLHIGIVAGSAFFVFRWLLSFCRPLLWVGRVKTAAAILAFFPALGYGLIAGMSPSTQRAVIMVAVFLMTFVAHREQDLFNTLAVAALVIIAVHPPTLYSLSFQLSFSAVAAIAYGFSRLMPAKESGGGPWGTLFHRVAVLFMVSLFATLGTLPLVMRAFNQVSLVGPVVNVVAVPLIGFVVVPLGLVAVLAASIVPAVASWGLTVCAYVLAAAMRIIEFSASFSFSAVKTVTPSVLETVCYYVLLWGVVTLAARGGEAVATVQSRRRVQAVAVAAVLLLGADLLYWVHERFFSRELRVTVLDVGQGSAALLELPGGYNMLIDGGGFSDNSVFDVGARIVAPYLWQRKIRTLDAVVLSHPNSDHLNGLTYIVEHFKVKAAWTNNERAATKGYRLFRTALRQRQVRHPPYDLLPPTRTINGVRLEFLHPEKDFKRPKNEVPWRSINNNSLVVKASYGEQAFLFPGDIEVEAEAALLERDPLALQSTVLLAPHHGSRSSSSPAFIERVDPEIVVISAGWNNRFRLPHREVLQRYRRQGGRIYRTDLSGAIRLTTDGATLAVVPTL